MKPVGSHPVVAIVGGGLTGAAVAYHLVRLNLIADAEIVVFEPRALLGAGLAYDTAEPAHRINVPASRMSLIADDLEHFQRWLTDQRLPVDDPDAVIGEGHVFVRRALFGQYVAAQLQPMIDHGRIVHRREHVTAVSPLPDRCWVLRTGDGSALIADIVVLATSHPAPMAPAGIDAILASHPRYVGDSNAGGRLAAIRTSDRVLLIGTGLTSADVIASLDARGHKGRITAVSRRGLRSRGNILDTSEPFGEFADPPARTALSLLVRIRVAISAAAGAGVSWHSMFDRVRAQASEIWLALPIAERRRLIMRLRPFWDVHRFRVAPQVEAALDRRQAEGTLQVLAASIVGASLDGDEIRVSLRRRHGRGTDEYRFDAVVVTTGPGHGAILDSQPYLRDLALEGPVALDPVGLGLHVDDDSQAMTRDGHAVEGLYVAGPLARGTFGELMGLPQVTEHAAFVATRLSACLAQRASGKRTPPISS